MAALSFSQRYAPPFSFHLLFLLLGFFICGQKARHQERRGGSAARSIREGIDLYNPRQSNGNLRRKHRARFRAMDAPCGICGGALGPIHYDEPSDAAHPLSFVIDEIYPVSKWRQYGYASPQAAANDWNNLQAAHWYCNAKKGAKVGYKLKINQNTKKPIERDGAW